LNRSDEIAIAWLGWAQGRREEAERKRMIIMKLASFPSPLSLLLVAAQAIQEPFLKKNESECDALR
jgi:hypothetical protein